MLEKKVKFKAEVSRDFPEVPFRSFEEAKGKIQEILKNPTIRKKWMKRMKGNLFAFKSGKYAKLPLYCNNCYVDNKCPFYQEPKEGEFVVCVLRNEFKKIIPKVNTRNREDLIESLYRLLKIQGERLGRNYYFECLSGGRQDRDLTVLIKSVEDTILKLIELTQSQPIMVENRLHSTIMENPKLMKIIQDVKSEKDIREIVEYLDQSLDQEISSEENKKK